MRSPSGAEDTGREEVEVDMIGGIVEIDVGEGVGSDTVAVGMAGVRLGNVVTVAVGIEVATLQAAS